MERVTNHISRRSFLRGMGIGGLGLGAAAVFGCGEGEAKDDGGVQIGTSTAEPTVTRVITPTQSPTQEATPIATKTPETKKFTTFADLESSVVFVTKDLPDDNLKAELMASLQDFKVNSSLSDDAGVLPAFNNLGDATNKMYLQACKVDNVALAQTAIAMRDFTIDYRRNAKGLTPVTEASLKRFERAWWDIDAMNCKNTFLLQASKS